MNQKVSERVREIHGNVNILVSITDLCFMNFLGCYYMIFLPNYLTVGYILRETLRVC